MFAARNINKGEIICNYNGELCPYNVFSKRQKMYDILGEGSYILEFKFKEKRWGIDATKDDNSFGRLINHSSKSLRNVKPVVGHKKGQPFIYFVAITNILKHKELLYDYSDNSKKARDNFPWLKN